MSNQTLTPKNEVLRALGEFKNALVECDKVFDNEGEQEHIRIALALMQAGVEAVMTLIEAKLIEAPEPITETPRAALLGPGDL